MEEALSTKEGAGAEGNAPDTRQKMLVILGPTASGKTKVSLELARRFPLEIICADSRQVYREMEIGTAKPDAHERLQAPHHLLDVVSPDQPFSVDDFYRLAKRAAASIGARGHVPCVVGGTGLYIRALTAGLLDAPSADSLLRARLLRLEEENGPGTLYRMTQHVDPEIARRLFPRDVTRLVRALEVFAQSGRRLSDLQREHGFRQQEFRTLKIGIAMPREELYRRIDERVDKMLAAGLLDEVSGLLARGYSPDLKAFQALGYREAVRCLKGEMTLEETRSAMKLATRHYARRQLTWFGREPDVLWVNFSENPNNLIHKVENFLITR